MNTAPESSRTRWLYAAALLLAVVVRVALLAEKPFWRDEAWMALLIERRDDGDFDPTVPRAAPVAFVELTRVAGMLPLPPEVSYRLPALLAGIALVPLLGRLAVALGAPAPIPLAVLWLAAGAPALVYYSRELKSYGLDAVVAALAALLALRITGRGEGEGLSPAAATAVFVAVAAIAPWSCYGGLFAIAGVLAWGWISWLRSADTVTRRRWLLISVVFTVSFAVAYWYAIEPQSSRPRLQATWARWMYAGKSESELSQVIDAVRRYLWLSTVFVFAGAWPLLIPAAALGAAVWARRGRAFLVWSYVAPGALAVAAALADRFLLAEGRLLLFVAPPLLLAAASGLAWGGRVWRTRPQALALAAAAALGIAWSAKAIAHRLPPYRNDLRAYFQYDILHDVGALVAEVTQRRPPGAPVFVSMYASKSYMYYNKGRLDEVTMCVDPCPTIGDVFDTWVDRLTRPGLLLVLDEERDSYLVRLPAHAATGRKVASARGGEVWEITRATP